MITPLPENFLARLLPPVVTDYDLQGRLLGFLSGVQDRQEDLRAFMLNLQSAFTPIHGPLNACVQTTFNDITGKLVQRNILQSSLIGQPELDDFRSGQLSDVDAAIWMGRVLAIEPRQIVSVTEYNDPEKKPIDGFEGLMGENLGAPLPPGGSDDPSLPALVQSWMSLVKIRGTPESMEAVGRLSGLATCNVHPLWQRLSPRIASSMTHRSNDADFALHPENVPGTPGWLPELYRTGPFYEWVSIAPFDKADEWLTAMLDCPFVNWIIEGIPANKTGVRGAWRSGSSYDQGDMVLHNGGLWIALTSLVQPESPGEIPQWKQITMPHQVGGRRFILQDGVPFKPAFVNMGSFRAEGKANGPDFDGLAIDSSQEDISGDWKLSIVDQLSAVQYRSSWMDVSGFVDVKADATVGEILEAAEQSEAAVSRAIQMMSELKPATRWIRHVTHGINLPPDDVEWALTLNTFDIPYEPIPTVPGPVGVPGVILGVEFRPPVGDPELATGIRHSNDPTHPNFNIIDYKTVTAKLVTINLKTGQMLVPAPDASIIVRLTWTLPPIIWYPDPAAPVEPNAGNPPFQNSITVPEDFIQSFEAPVDELIGPNLSLEDTIDWNKVPLMGGKEIAYPATGRHSSALVDQSGKLWNVRARFLPGQDLYKSSDPQWLPPIVEFVPADETVPLAPITSILGGSATTVGCTTGLVYGQLVSMPERFGSQFLRNLVGWVPMMEHSASKLTVMRVAPTEVPVEVIPPLVPADRYWMPDGGWCLKAVNVDENDEKTLIIPVQGRSDGTFTWSIMMFVTDDSIVKVTVGPFEFELNLGTGGSFYDWNNFRFRMLSDRWQLWRGKTLDELVEDFPYDPLEPFEFDHVKIVAKKAAIRDFRIWDVYKTRIEMHSMWRVPAFKTLSHPTVIYDTRGNSCCLRLYEVNFVFPTPVPLEMSVPITKPPYGASGGTAAQGFPTTVTTELFLYDPVYDGSGHTLDDEPTNNYGWNGGNPPQLDPPWQLGNAVDEVVAIGAKPVGSPDPMENPNKTVIFLRGDVGVYQLTLDNGVAVIVPTDVLREPPPGIVEWDGLPPLVTPYDPADNTIVSVRFENGQFVLYKTTTPVAPQPPIYLYSPTTQKAATSGLSNLDPVSPESQAAGLPTLASAGKLSWTFTSEAFSGETRILIKAHNQGQVPEGFTGFDVEVASMQRTLGAVHLAPTTFSQSNPDVEGEIEFLVPADDNPTVGPWHVSIEWTGLLDDPIRGIEYVLQIDSIIVEYLTPRLYKNEGTNWVLQTTVSPPDPGGFMETINEDGTHAEWISESSDRTRGKDANGVPYVPGIPTPWTASAAITGCTVDRDDSIMMAPHWVGPKVISDPVPKPPPTGVPLTAPPQPIQVGDTISFTLPESPTYRVGVYRWPDGTVSAIQPGETVQKGVNKGGSWIVELVVVDELGQSATTSVTFLVNDPPVILAIRISANDKPAPYSTTIEIDVRDPDGTGPITVFFNGETRTITTQVTGHTEGTASFVLTVTGTAGYLARVEDSNGGETEFTLDFRAATIQPVLLALQADPLVAKPAAVSGLDIVAWMTDANRPAPATATITFLFMEDDQWSVSPLLDQPGFESITGGAKYVQTVPVIQGQAQFQMRLLSLVDQTPGAKVIRATVQSTGTAEASVQITLVANQTPVIDRFNIVPPIVVPNAPTMIECVCHDPDGDLLVVSWSFDNANPASSVSNPASITPLETVIKGEVTVADSYGAFVTQVIPSVIITSPLTANGYINRSFSYAMTAMSATEPTWSVTGTLPPGLNFVIDHITGTPSILGTTTVTLVASTPILTTTQTLDITIFESAVPPLTPTNLIVNGSGTNPRYSTGQALIVQWTITNDALGVPYSAIELRSVSGALVMTIAAAPGINTLSIPYTTIVSKYGSPQDVIIRVYSERDGARSVFPAETRVTYIPG